MSDLFVDIFSIFDEMSDSFVLIFSKLDEMSDSFEDILLVLISILEVLTSSSYIIHTVL